MMPAEAWIPDPDVEREAASYFDPWQKQPEPDAEPGEFWSARPALAHIRTFAKARRVSPDAMLGVVLARVVAKVPPHYVLPPTIGTDVSLNLFVALVGRSGDGKGAATGAAADAVKVGPLAAVSVGSGEGLTHAFVRREKGAVVQHTTNVFAEVPEVDTLAALTSRQGATLLPTLRSCYTGETFGFGYADPQKRLTVKAHEYRLSLVVGVQPGRAGALLDDTDGGTPQRFLWLPSTDPDAPDVAPAEPTPLRWRMPAPPAVVYGDCYRLPVCETAVLAVTQARLDRTRGKTDALDGHALLTRLKVAAALGLLDGRIEVADDDWWLAGTLMAVSDATRTQVLADLTLASRDRNRARGNADADRAVIVTEKVEGVAVSRVARGIHRKLAASPEGLSGAALRRVTAHRDRPLLDDAIHQLLDAGRIFAETIIPDDNGSGGEGVCYRVGRP